MTRITVASLTLPYVPGEFGWWKLTFPNDELAVWATIGGVETPIASGMEFLSSLNNATIPLRVAGVGASFAWSYLDASVRMPTSLLTLTDLAKVAVVEVDIDTDSDNTGSINREFRDFTRLVTPAHRGEIISAAKASDVLAARWRRPAGEYWVVVNGQPNERPLTLDTNSKDSTATLAPWGSTREVGATLRDGVLVVESAQPWEVFVWKETGS